MLKVVNTKEKLSKRCMMLVNILVKNDYKVYLKTE